jgi:glycosyltransferase involved in cell wall biosynthesis
MSSPDAPRISILIPVYNEEPLLRAAAVDLRERLAPLAWSYEVILAENGSRDGTVAEARALCARYPEFHTFSVGEPNYGRALRQAILQARGELVICDEIDLCDTDFHQAAVALLDANEADFVIGSKLLAGSRDERPLARHLASQLYNGLLRAMLGFRGTDTHGLKAFRRALLVPIVHQCTVDRDVFASELVIRADRAGIRMREIPVRVLEKRPPSVDLVRRMPAVLRQLTRLTWSIRVRGSGG